MARKWYYAVKGKKAGPVGSQELKQLADSGALNPWDLVWAEGMAQWAPASRVKGLFPEEKLVPPPLPPADATPAVEPNDTRADSRTSVPPSGTAPPLDSSRAGAATESVEPEVQEKLSKVTAAVEHLSAAWASILKDMDQASKAGSSRKAFIKAKEAIDEKILALEPYFQEVMQFDVTALPPSFQARSKAVLDQFKSSKPARDIAQEIARIKAEKAIKVTAGSDSRFAAIWMTGVAICGGLFLVGMNKDLAFGGMTALIGGVACWFFYKKKSSDAQDNEWRLLGASEEEVALRREKRDVEEEIRSQEAIARDSGKSTADRLTAQSRAEGAKARLLSIENSIKLASTRQRDPIREPLPAGPHSSRAEWIKLSVIGGLISAMFIVDLANRGEAARVSKHSPPAASATPTVVPEARQDRGLVQGAIPVPEVHAQTCSSMQDYETGLRNGLKMAPPCEILTSLPECSGEYDRSTWSECYGVRQIPGGAMYRGSYLTGKANGKGEFVNPDGTRYIGEYIAGQRQGFGREFDSKGALIRQGQWVGGVYINVNPDITAQEPCRAAGESRFRSADSGVCGGFWNVYQSIPEGRAWWADKMGTSTFAQRIAEDTSNTQRQLKQCEVIAHVSLSDWFDGFEKNLVVVHSNPFPSEAEARDELLRARQCEATGYTKRSTYKVVGRD